MIINRIALFATSLLLLSSQYAYSVTSNGSLGWNSTGSFDVSLTIPEKIMISGLQEIALGEWDRESSMESSVNACIYTNGDGNYSVTMSDNSSLSSGFALEDADRENAIPMTVRFNDENNTANNILVAEGTTTATQSGANTQSQDCAGKGNMNIQVLIDELALSTVPSGAYNSQITIMVDPN